MILLKYSWRVVQVYRSRLVQSNRRKKSLFLRNRIQLIQCTQVLTLDETFRILWLSCGLNSASPFLNN